MAQTYFIMLLATVFLPWGSVFAQQFDQSPAWPLCGRITANPPTGWMVADGCPPARWGNTAHTDLPLASPFGPRPLASENNRYDFHRGIDIATDVGTPVFAIANGVVTIAGEHTSYADPLVQLRHYRPGYASCQGTGCYHSNYMHLSSVTVNVDDNVRKGDLIGYTGTSASGFAHLHFEIRDAPAFDPFSRWQRDAIHPLDVLPYQSSETVSATFDAVDTGTPGVTVVQVTIQTARVDVQRVELELYDANQNLLPQPGNVPDSNGYNVYPAWFDMNTWNFQYSHKDSSNFPWESFGAGGENECPYYAAHNATYDAHVHLDAQDTADFHVGRFNGVRIQPQKYTVGDYSLTLTFEQLQGAADCIVAHVLLATGGIATTQWGNCSGSLPPQADAQSVATDEDQAIDITLTGSTTNGGNLDFEIVSPPAYGALSGIPPAVTYAPDADYNGSDSFDFVLHDALATSDVATVAISVHAVNDPPTADDQSVTTLKDTPVAITLSGHDVDGDPLSAAVASGPLYGTLSGSGSDRTYTPAPGYTGTDAFTFIINDASGASATAMVFITVKKGKGGNKQDGGGQDKPPRGKK